MSGSLHERIEGAPDRIHGCLDFVLDRRDALVVASALAWTLRGHAQDAAPPLQITDVVFRRLNDRRASGVSRAARGRPRRRAARPSPPSRPTPRRVRRAYVAGKRDRESSATRCPRRSARSGARRGSSAGVDAAPRPSPTSTSCASTRRRRRSGGRSARRASRTCEYAQAAYRVHPTFVPNDPFYATQWNLPLIDMERPGTSSRGAARRSPSRCSTPASRITNADRAANIPRAVQRRHGRPLPGARRPDDPVRRRARSRARTRPLRLAARLHLERQRRRSISTATARTSAARSAS